MWCNRNALKRSNWRNCAKLFRRIIRTRFDMIRKREKSKGISFDTTSTEIYRDNTCYLFSFPLVFVTIMLRDRDFNVRSFPIFWKILPLKLASSVRYGLLPFVSSSVFFLIAFILSFFPVSFFFFFSSKVLRVTSKPSIFFGFVRVFSSTRSNSEAVCPMSAISFLVDYTVYIYIFFFFK